MYRIMFYILIFLLISMNLFSDGIEPIGSGMQTDPYQVETLDNLLWISTNDTSWNKYYIQISDIDASDTQNWNNGAGFSPISFTGNYDGHFHKILNLYINRTSYTGFFSSCTGEVSNLGLENVDISGTSVVGSIAARMNLHALVRNCYSTGDVNGDSSVGGLVGVMNNWSIIEQSYSACNVSGSNNTGGLIGYEALYSEIYNCYATGIVTGGSRTGGFVGSVSDNSDIYNCYSTGIVTGGSWSGGFEGLNGAGSIHNCFWDVDTSGCPDGMYQAGEGISTEEMKTLSTFIDVGWDFMGETANGEENVWGMHFYENSRYPFLFWQGYNHDLINDPPTLDSEIENIIVLEDFMEPVSINLSDHFSDPDGYALIYSISSNSDLANPTLVDSILNINSLENMNGEMTIYVTAEDTFIPESTDMAGRESTTVSFVINVSPVNDSPEIMNNLPEELNIDITEEQDITFSVEVEDIDSELEYSWFINDQELNESTSICSSTFSENGNFEIKIIVADEEFELETVWNVTVNITGLDDNSINPLENKLLGNSPNPFNPSTTIKFSLERKSNIELTIHNIKGQKIKSLLKDQITAGKHSIIWNGKDDINMSVSSGVYLYKLKVNDKTEAMKKCLLLK